MYCDKRSDLGSAVISINDGLQQKHESREERSDVVVCGLSLARFGPNGQFLICSAGILFFFVLYGYLQEFIFAYGDFKPYGWHLTLMQFAYYSIFGFIELQFKQNSGTNVRKQYCLICFGTAL